MTLIEPFLPFTFRASTNQLSLYSFPASLNCGIGLTDLRPIVIALQLHEEVALVNLLVVGHIHRLHNARHLGTERSKVSANVCIVCNLVSLATLPRIPL